MFQEEYEVETCNNGQEALRLFERFKPDLIILDVVMPEMDGFEVCQHLKQDPTTAYIPIVMLTASQDLESRLKGCCMLIRPQVK